MQLAGKLLISMPALGDPRFQRSVILICAHGPEGAMGLVVNQPVPEPGFTRLLEQLNIPRAAEGREIQVHQGGPVERGRGFVLHSQDYPGGPATLQIEGGLALTATLDILEALARGDGPRDALLALGYSGWGPGQLEAEIRRNDWLIAEAPTDLIFSGIGGGKWAEALRRNGIDPVSLSGSGGRA
jgi:putative transcriptional regulator